MTDKLDAALALIQKAAALHDADDFHGALEIYTQLLSEYPRAILYHQRGVTYSDLRQFSNAIADFTKALEIGIDSPAETYIDRGNAFFRQDQHEAAIKDYTTAIELLSPTLAYAFNGRGSALMKLNRMEEALRDLGTATHVDGSYTSPLYNLGALLFRSGNHEQALLHLDEAHKLDAEDATILRLRGEVHAARRDFDKAISDYQQALAINPKYTLAHRNLAWVLSTCPDDSRRDGVLATAHARQSCELSNWKDAECLATLAAACAECRDFTEAVRWQRMALEIDADDQELHQMRLGRLEQQLPIRE